jgi:hypothetical protein
MAEKCDRAVGAMRAHADSRTALFESRQCLATRTTIKRNCFGPLFFFSCCVQFPSTSALEAILLGNPSHSKPVDDKWQMIGPLSPNHPAEVLKK